MAQVAKFGAEEGAIVANMCYPHGQIVGFSPWHVLDMSNSFDREFRQILTDE